MLFFEEMYYNLINTGERRVKQDPLGKTAILIKNAIKPQKCVHFFTPPKTQLKFTENLKTEFSKSCLYLQVSIFLAKAY